MPQIKKLDKETISKIAAGEVVDRPASVIKELIENAIDAKAKNIKIFTLEGGTKEITVVDDGVGMAKEDLHECFKRHTTSKISSLADIENISSFGFRGEALSSISYVSNLNISSREPNALEGNYIDIEAGELLGSGMVGMPPGTKITVRNLFHNIPARRKYLKKVSEELRLITNVVTKMCIMYPEINFKFFHNESELIGVSGDDSHESRIKNLYSDGYFHTLIPVEGNDAGFEVTGFISRPNDSRTAKFKQHLFINKRQVHDSKISDAVKSAYGSLIEARKYPQYILFIDVPSNTIDINIHKFLT